MKGTATPETIARWMLATFAEHGILIQARAAFQIRREFGEEFVYRNNNRNWAIRKDILDIFRSLTPDDVVWSRSRQLWRRRRENDPPDIRMVR